MQEKVLPRRTSATLSSLKLAKYSLSAAVLSKLPTQARKRYQLPGGGGEASCGQGALHTVPGGHPRWAMICREGNCPLVLEPRQWGTTSALSGGEGDAEPSSSPSELRIQAQTRGRGWSPDSGPGYIWLLQRLGVRMKMQSQSGARKPEPSIGHCQVLVWELGGVRLPVSTPPHPRSDLQMWLWLAVPYLGQM